MVRCSLNRRVLLFHCCSAMSAQRGASPNSTHSEMMPVAPCFEPAGSDSCSGSNCQSICRHNRNDAKMLREHDVRHSNNKSTHSLLITFATMRQNSCSMRDASSYISKGREHKARIYSDYQDPTPREGDHPHYAGFYSPVETSAA